MGVVAKHIKPVHRTFMFRGPNVLVGAIDNGGITQLGVPILCDTVPWRHLERSRKRIIGQRALGKLGEARYVGHRMGD